MLKLFMFYVGGDCGNSNIELHDVRFAVGATAEDCHDDLRRQWWGTPKSLHLDCWGAVGQADGYDVALTAATRPDAEEKMFFLNLGGYDRTQFGELHRNMLLVAPNAKAAIARALAQAGGWYLPHRDNVLEVEKTVDVSEQMRDRGYGLSLTRAAEEKPFRFVCKYLRLG